MEKMVSSLRLEAVRWLTPRLDAPAHPIAVTGQSYRLKDHAAIAAKEEKIITLPRIECAAIGAGNGGIGQYGICGFLPASPGCPGRRFVRRLPRRRGQDR
jgi:hypothetical protein